MTDAYELTAEEENQVRQAIDVFDFPKGKMLALSRFVWKERMIREYGKDYDEDRAVASAFAEMWKNVGLPCKAIFMCEDGTYPTCISESFVETAWTQQEIPAPEGSFSKTNRI